VVVTIISNYILVVILFGDHWRVRTLTALFDEMMHEVMVTIGLPL